MPPGRAAQVPRCAWSVAHDPIPLWIPSDRLPPPADGPQTHEGPGIAAGALCAACSRSFTIGAPASREGRPEPRAPYGAATVTFTPARVARARPLLPSVATARSAVAPAGYARAAVEVDELASVPV